MAEVPRGRGTGQEWPSEGWWVRGPWTSWSAFQPDGPAHQPPRSSAAAPPAAGGRFWVHCSHTARVGVWRLLTERSAFTSCVCRVICDCLYSSHSFSFIKKIMVHLLISYFWVHIFKPYMVETYGIVVCLVFFNFPWKPAERMFWGLFFFLICQVDISVWYWQEDLYSVGGCSPSFQA